MGAPKFLRPKSYLKYSLYKQQNKSSASILALMFHHQERIKQKENNLSKRLLIGI